MALDPSIILQAGRGVVPLLSPTDIQDQQMQREMGRYKLNALRQESEDDAAYRNVLRSGATPDELPNKLYSAGLGKRAQEALKFQSEQAKTARESEKTMLDMKIKRLEAAANIAGTVNDQASYERALPLMRDLDFDISKFSPQYNPEGVRQFAMATLSAKERLTAQTQMRGQDITMRGQDMTQSTTLRGQDLSRDTALRGQDLTDTRAREKNATLAEEARIKREAKDDTANLTKASQIASFDTMLGTLDRLSKHPGLARSVGLVGALPTVPGSDSANFQAELNTFQSQAFLPMVAQLKGMGALSDAEGKKLTAAVGALDPKMGEKAFRDSVKRITDDMDAARKRMVGGGAPGKSLNTRTVDVGGSQMQARQAPDGKFYVQQGGKWFEVKE